MIYNKITKAGECMLTYSIKKVIALMIVLLGATCIVFLVMNMSPGDPATFTLSDPTPEQLQEWREYHGLAEPVMHSYVRYISGLFRGELSPVMPGFRGGHDPTATYTIMQNLSYTLRLMLVSISASIALALPIGALAATGKSLKPCKVIKYIAVIGKSLPVFLLGMLLITMQRLTIMPGLRYHLLLASVVLGVGIFCAILPAIHASFVMRHKSNIAVTIFTAIRDHLGTLFTGIVIVEFIFNRPGIGRLLMQGIAARNYALVLACVTVFILLYAAINLIMDIVRAIIDPRMRRVLLFDVE